MPRILVVDDDVPLTRALERRLQAAGFDVRTVNHARAAAAVVFQYRPDLVLLDIEMPSYTGLEFHECLRGSDRGRGIPIVYMTGHDCSIYREQAREQGASGFLAKPYEASTLLDTVRETLVGFADVHSHSRTPEPVQTPR